MKSLSPENSYKPKAMPRGRPFQKGKSGNPGGRPKRTPEETELIEACRAKTAEALETILQVMETSTNDRVRLAAAQYVIERGWGKAPERIELFAAKVDLTHDDLDMSPEAVYLRFIKGIEVPEKVLPSTGGEGARRGLAAILEEAKEVRL